MRSSQVSDIVLDRRICDEERMALDLWTLRVSLFCLMQTLDAQQMALLACPSLSSDPTTAASKPDNSQHRNPPRQAVPANASQAGSDAPAIAAPSISAVQVFRFFALTPGETAWNSLASSQLQKTPSVQSVLAQQTLSQWDLFRHLAYRREPSLETSKANWNQSASMRNPGVSTSTHANENFSREDWDGKLEAVSLYWWWNFLTVSFLCRGLPSSTTNLILTLWRDRWDSCSICPDLKNLLLSFACYLLHDCVQHVLEKMVTWLICLPNIYSPTSRTELSVSLFAA